MNSFATFRRFAILVALLTALWIGLSSYLIPGSTQQSAIAHRGFLAPDFALKSLDGETVRLSEFRGKAIILNFWASWCPPCREEMPALQRVSQAYQSRGVEVIAVNVTSEDVLSSVQEFIQSSGVTFTVLLDEQGEVQSVYRTSGLPTTVFIDQEGIIRDWIVGGPLPEALLLAQAEKFSQGEP